MEMRDQIAENAIIIQNVDAHVSAAHNASQCIEAIDFGEDYNNYINILKPTMDDIKAELVDLGIDELVASAAVQKFHKTAVVGEDYTAKDLSDSVADFQERMVEGDTGISYTQEEYVLWERVQELIEKMEINMFLYTVGAGVPAIDDLDYEFDEGEHFPDYDEDPLPF